MSRRRWPYILLGLLGFIALFAGARFSDYHGQWLRGVSGAPGIESHLANEAADELTTLGVADFEVDPDGRNLKVTTTSELPLAAMNNLRSIDGVGSIDFVSTGTATAEADTVADDQGATAATDPAEGVSDEPEPEPTAVPVPAGGDLDIEFDGENVILQGEVQDEEGRDAVIRAARRLAGDGTVDDQISVVGGNGSDVESVATVAAIVRRLDEWFVDAEVELDGDELVVNGSALTNDDVERAQQVVEQLTERVGMQATVNGVIVEPAAAPVSEGAREVVAALDLSGVTFELGTAELTADAQTILDDVAGQLRELPGVDVEVQGHTDSLGDPDVNLLLSQQRAEAVRNYLIDAGIGADSLTARGFGAGQPIADNSTEEGQAANRRVDLAVTEGSN